MCCILISDLLLLQRGLTHTLESAYATGTKANFPSKIRAFFLFTTYFGPIPYPVSEDTLCLYAQFLSNSFESVQAIRSYIQAIKHFHFISGYSVKPFEGIKLQLALRGLGRTISKPPRQAQPLSTDILRAIHATLNPLLPNDVVFWCILLFGFFSFARISNLVKTCYTEFQITRGQVFWSERLMLLNFTRTKTLQFGEKVLKIPVLANPGSKLCPVSAYKEMVRQIPAPADAPAFVTPQGAGLRPYTYSLFERNLKSAIAKVGLDPSKFSSHSMRRGGASSAFQVGVPTELIQKQGDWASDAYLRYITVSEPDRLKIAQALNQLSME